MCYSIHTFYKNPIYKNHEAQISEILRIFWELYWGSITRPLWFHSFDKVRTYFENIVSRIIYELYKAQNVKNREEKKYDSYKNSV